MAATTPSSPAPFRGFPPEAVDFYRRLETDNTKRFWDENRAVYDECVKAPFVSLAAELADTYGEFHLFRPYRDVRFSKDKRPYKTEQGMVTEGEGGALYYVRIAADGLLVGSGMYHMARDQLERYRAAVDTPAGDELDRIMSSIEKRFDIMGDALTTAPRGYARDHPRIHLLRRKGLVAARSFGTPAWLSTRKARTRIVESWEGAAALNDWLEANVGPSEEPPDDT